jgi:hypothetical protein
MKRWHTLAILLLVSSHAWSWSNFLENPYTPYPAGCSAAADWWEVPNNPYWVEFHEGTIMLRSTRNRPSPMVVKAYRAACVEPGRSLIWLQFTTPDDRTDGFYFVPSARIMHLRDRFDMSLARELGSWNEGSEPTAYPSVFGLNNCAGNNGFCSTYGWSFVLDNSSPLTLHRTVESLLTADEYNDRFILELAPDPGGPVYRIDVPATAELLYTKPSMPFSGRHSGLWVTEGAADQGFNIAVSEIVSDGLPWYGDDHSLFLSWYTFDKDGNPLWLTGAARFAFGASELSFDLVLVTDGEFSSSKAASRRTVGSVTLKADSCNDLGLDYDLGELELGTGSKRLQRLFSLELAGHACRDMQARIDSQ